MSVLVEAYSIIVRCTTLEASYPNGVGGYARDCPNQSFCSDGILTRVGFMDSSETRAWFEMLKTRLQHLHSATSAHVAVISQSDGFLTACDWLDGGTIEGQDVGIVWLKGKERGVFAAPLGWSLEQSKGLRHFSEDELRKRVLDLGLGEAIDMDTGHRIYTSFDNAPMIPDHPPESKPDIPLQALDDAVFRGLSGEMKGSDLEIEIMRQRRVHDRQIPAYLRHVAKVLIFGFVLGIVLRACGIA